ncbi:MAG: hypothetical protein Q4F74_07810 [Synergistaceae bacterium]|nr:hypothetical protein [Synergistaceae bacterium]
MKKFLAVLFMLVFSVVLISSTFAASDVWDGKSVKEIKPYQDYLNRKSYNITSAAELAWVAKMVNEGTTFKDCRFRLRRDIDLGNHEWTPIGNAPVYFEEDPDDDGTMYYDPITSGVKW